MPSISTSEKSPNHSPTPDLYRYVGIVQAFLLVQMGVYEDSTHPVPRAKKSMALHEARRSFTCAVSSLLRQLSEGGPLPRTRIQVVHGTVPQKCAGNTLPAPPSILSRSALGELRCHPLPTSLTRAPEVTPN